MHHLRQKNHLNYLIVLHLIIFIAGYSSLIANDSIAHKKKLIKAVKQGQISAAKAKAILRRSMASQQKQTVARDVRQRQRQNAKPKSNAANQFAQKHNKAARFSNSVYSSLTNKLTHRSIETRSSVSLQKIAPPQLPPSWYKDPIDPLPPSWQKDPQDTLPPSVGLPPTVDIPPVIGPPDQEPIPRVIIGPYDREPPPKDIIGPPVIDPDDLPLPGDEDPGDEEPPIDEIPPIEPPPIDDFPIPPADDKIFFEEDLTELQDFGEAMSSTDPNHQEAITRIASSRARSSRSTTAVARILRQDAQTRMTQRMVTRLQNRLIGRVE